jgi:hypothetical protein
LLGDRERDFDADFEAERDPDLELDFDLGLVGPALRSSGPSLEREARSDAPSRPAVRVAVVMLVPAPEPAAWDELLPLPGLARDGLRACDARLLGPASSRPSCSS